MSRPGPLCPLNPVAPPFMLPVSSVRDAVPSYLSSCLAHYKDILKIFFKFKTKLQQSVFMYIAVANMPVAF